MSLIKQLAKETAIYGISSILARLLPFVIFTPFYTWLFEKIEYGIVTEVYVWTAVLIVLFTYRMETTFFRFGSKKEDMEKAFSTASLSLILTTVLFGGILLLLTPTITELLFKEASRQPLFLLLVSIVALDTLAAIPFARLRLEKRPMRFAVIKIVNILTNIAFVFFFLMACPWLIDNGYSSFEYIYEEESRITYVFWANLIASLVTLIIFLPMYGKMKFKFDLNLWKRMLVYTGPLIIVGLAGVINQLSGNTLIKELASDDYNRNFEFEAIYAAIAKLAVFMNLFTQAFNYAAEPFFFNNAHRKDARQNYADVARLFTITGVFVFLGIWFYIDIVKRFIADKYHEHLEIAPILLLAYLFLGLYYNFSIWYKLTDQTKYGGAIALAGVVITLGLNLTLIPDPDISFYGPAWAALACYFFMTSIAYLLGRKKYPIPYEIGRMAAAIIIGLLLFGVSFWMRNVIGLEPITLMLSNTVLLVVFALVIYRMEKPFFERVLRT